MVNKPQIKKAVLAPYLSAAVPANMYPIGAVPEYTIENTLITLPLYSSLEVSCSMELAVVLNHILNTPEVP